MVGSFPWGVCKLQMLWAACMWNKCWYVYKDAVISDAAGKKNFCLKKDELGNIYLDKCHAHYYQVQAQVFICEVKYCDFVVYTTQDLFAANSSWLRASGQFTTCCHRIFSKCLLPEKVAVIYVNAVKFTPTLTHHHQQVMKTMWKGLSATVSDMWEEVHLSGVTMTHAR